MKPRLGSATKGDLINFLQKFSDLWTIGSLGETLQAVVIDRGKALDYLLFLYFGQLKDGLGDFALRDLGILKTRQSNREFQARFKVREVIHSEGDCGNPVENQSKMMGILV